MIGAGGVGRRILHCGAALALLGGVACGQGGDRVTLQVERDTLGDTIVVRTLAGSEWGAPATLEPEMRIGTFEGEDVYMLGEVTGFAVAPAGDIYLYDAQVPALRKYDSDGTHVATFGREGSGPGEYKQSDGGVGVLPDGRVLLRDPGNARINVYSPDGEPIDHWELRGGHFTSRPLYVDTAGRVYTQIWGRNPAGESYGGLQGYRTTGEKADSLIAPEWGYEGSSISASGESFSIMNSVPFSPTEMWTFSPHGYFVGGVSDRYSFDVFRPGSTVLRIERQVEPVAVHADEKANREEIATANFKRMVPDWTWNGPPIPDRKPPFRAILTGRDGRIWVQLSTVAEPVPADELTEPADPSGRPPERWREPLVWDVFAPDGTYLGRVEAAARISTYPQPIFDGDRVWAVVKDELDVEYLTRFRIAHREGMEGA